MTKKLITYLLIFFSSTFFSQNNCSFIFPLDSPYNFSANYGELRPNHFHAGLDFTTGGQINMPVYAVEEGYVSRIKISPTGYGKCVYITHPNGKVSVYAHLNAFALKIDKIVKQEQYAQQSYEIEIFPKLNILSVRKNEIIAMSGNTGGSTGPHLHFEIRDAKTEVPYNPLLYLKIRDKVKPVVNHVAFYSLADTSAPKFLKSFLVKPSNEDSIEANKDPIYINESILGFAFSGIDRFTEGGSPNNIFSVKLFLDGRLIYNHQLNNIGFDESRYINEYSESVSRITYQKCFLPTSYPNHFQTNCFNKGRIIIKNLQFHYLKLIVTDEVGNERKFWFKLKIKDFNFYASPSIRSDMYVNCSKNYFVKKKGIQLKIPANTLYYSTPLIFENTIETTGKLIVLPSSTNLKTAVTLGFKVPKKYNENKKRLLLKNETSIYTPINKGDSVFYSIKNFGWFQLTIDSLSPIIKTHLDLYRLRGISQLNSLSFTIVDRLSGIGKYKLFLNEKWVLAEFDLKNNLLTYDFDEETPWGIIKVKLDVEDKVGNKSTFETILSR